MSAGELSSGDYKEEGDDNDAEENDFNDAASNYSDEAPRNQKDPRTRLFPETSNPVKRSAFYNNNNNNGFAVNI